MSDNKNIAIQDRGWNDMHSILDREMPLKEKKRRFIPWFIFGLFVIVILGTVGTTSFFTSNSSKTIGDEVVKKDMIADKTENELLISENNIINSEKGFQKNEVTIASKSNNYSLSIDNLSLKQSESEVESNDAMKYESRSNNPSIENNQLNEPTITTINYAPTNDNKATSNLKFKGDMPSSNNNLFQNDPVNNNKASKVEHEGNDKIIDFIAPIEDQKEMRSIDIDINSLPNQIPFLLIPEKKIDFQRQSPVIKVDHKNVISPYVYAASNYQSSTKGLGYGFGAGLNYKLPKLSLYLEAGYSKTNYNAGEVSSDFSPSGPVLEMDDEFMGNTIAGQEGFTNLKFENFSNITSSITELKLNFGLRKEISSRLNLDFGIAYSRLLQVSNKSLEVSVETSGAIFMDITKVNVSSSELYETGAYSSYDIVPHIGIEYNFAPGAYIGLNYNHGLKNLIANTELVRVNSLATNESFLRRNMEAKIRYQF